MSTVTAVPNGFSILGANSIYADLSLSPANGSCTITSKFPRSAAAGANALSACFIRDLPDGTQEFSSVPLHTTTPPVPFPDGTFTGRSATWAVADQGVNRTLTINVTSTDGTGTGEVWHLDQQVCLPAGGETNFTLVAVAPNASITDVTASP
jgi:hypothetical protein